MLFLDEMSDDNGFKASDARRLWLKRQLTAVSLALLIYVINRFFLKHLDIPYIGYILRCHLNDFIGGFVFPAYVNTLLIVSKRKPITKLGMLLLFMLGVALLWEYVFPLFLSYSTSDFWDVIAYLSGAYLYYLVMKKNNNMIAEEG